MASSATNFAVPVLRLLVLSSCLALCRCAKLRKNYPPNCPPFQCGKLGVLSLPLADITHPQCGFFIVDGCNKKLQSIQFEKGSGKWYDLLDIKPDGCLHLRDPELASHLRNRNYCEASYNFSFHMPSSFSSPRIFPTLPLLKCIHTNYTPPPNFTDFSYNGCKGYTVYYNSFSKPPLNLHPQSCSIIQLPVVANETLKISDDLFHFIAPDFFLNPKVSPDCIRCFANGGFCGDDSKGEFQCVIKPNSGNDKSRLELATGLGFSAILVGAVVVLLVYCYWSKSLSNGYVFFWKKNDPSVKRVEATLKSYGAFAPKRYTYSEVKKITNSFKSKLGEGGYGRVYQGQLPDGHAVAVKFLKESKGSGEEFVNEVASISRTSHVNIVTLMGFCFEGSKRALIYEFMPNGSLEKFIYIANMESTARQLGWETLYQITLGIARGLEYLHRGCNTRIVHFDIKPHNILLDEDFCPKIAGFGLSKLCSNRKDSILSMLGARGTPGYIAPEVFCRNFGGVSHKSDVYSYGMMVLEMVGGRKNIEVGVDHTSEIYFPHWIHGRLNRVDEELKLHGIVEEEEREKARKMIIVGLWCIQIDPECRPAMHSVLNMLQGSLESLQIPPLPTLSTVRNRQF